MENNKLEQEIDELAEIRADLLLLKKQLGRQERTILPSIAKWFYAACVLFMFVQIGVQLSNGNRIQEINKEISGFLDTYQLIPE